MKIILGGALGRMGKQVTEAAAAAGHEIVCGVDLAAQPGSTAVTDWALVPADCGAQVVIDFSKPSSLEGALSIAKKLGIPVILCATGYTEEQLKRIADAAKDQPVLQSGNMSLGMNVLLQLCENAARALKKYDVEIIERHHRMKVDAPSGTALMLQEAVQAGRDDPLTPVHGREGHTGVRPDNQIGVLSVRGGTNCGEHEVCFYGPSEQVILQHRAENRSLFAQGALTAAEWMAGKENGLYSMQDVVRDLLKG